MAKLDRPPQIKHRWGTSIDDHVISLEWSPDGSRVAAASVSGPISIFEVTEGKLICQLPGHSFGTNRISWHPDGNRLASCGQDAKARIWDISTAKEIVAFDAGATWVEVALWSPKGKHLLTAAGKKLRLWNEQGELLQAHPDAEATVTDAIWDRRGSNYLSGGYGGAIVNAPDKIEPITAYKWRGAVLRIALSPDGKYLAAGAQESAIHFWLTKTGDDFEMTGYPTKVQELAWDASSRFLATGGGELVTIWDCKGKGPAGTAPLQFELHAVPLTAVAFQHRGGLLASGCGEGQVALWFPDGMKRNLGLLKLEEGVSQLRWSPGDGYLAIGGEQGQVAVYSV